MESRKILHADFTHREQGFVLDPPRGTVRNGRIDETRVAFGPTADGDSRSCGDDGARIKTMGITQEKVLQALDNRMPRKRCSG